MLARDLQFDTWNSPVPRPGVWCSRETADGLVLILKESNTVKSLETMKIFSIRSETFNSFKSPPLFLTVV